MNYGLPYKGSKSRIASQIYELFPVKENFYDLFAGGCAMSHFVRTQKQFKQIYVNDLNPICIELFKDALKGKFKNETRWISREDFEESEEPYVKFCWSFGNGLKTYLYSREIEPYKKACHYAIVFDDFSLLKECCPDIYDCTKEALKNEKDITKRRLKFGPAVVKKLKELNDYELVKNNPLYLSCHWRGNVKKDLTINSKKETSSLGESEQTDLESLQSLERLESLQSLERLESLQSLERLERLQSLERLERRIFNFSIGSYDDVEIKKNSVIYCDIPYEGASDYIGSFDHKKFREWCKKQTEPLFISSYKMPEDDFVCVARIKHICSLSGNSTYAVTEKVFIPKHQAETYRLPNSLFNFDELEV